MGFLSRFRSTHLALWLLAGIHLSCAKTSSTATAAPRLSGTLEYKIGIKDPSQQYLQVSMQVPRSAARGAKTQVAMPAWAPGSYLIRDFGRHVYKVKAQDAKGQALVVNRDNKQQWTIHNKGRAFTLHYEIFADELTVRTAFVNDSMALLNTAAVFMYPRKGKHLDARVSVAPPPQWKVFTALDKAGSEYTSPNYDELVDAPIMMAPKAFVKRFKVDKTEFEYVAIAPSGTNVNFERLATDAKAVVQSFVDLMGEVNFGRYSFLVVLDPLAGGGLEHKYSTAMILPPYSFDQKQGYTYAASLLAHEFFHAWNVKRIHDKKLGPFDYDKEVYTDLLWFHEGFTETIEAQSLRIAKAYTAQEYLNKIAESWTRYLAHPGRNHDSIAQLSRDAWIKFYRRAANKKNVSVSYYQKGDLIGVCLDLKIRLAAAKKGRKASLASMFRNMWGKRAHDTTLPITKANVFAAANKEAGEDLSEFFERYVYGTEELPLPELLRQAGIEVKARKPWLTDEGKPSEALLAKRYFSGLSMRGPVVQSVEPQSPAVRAGIHAHDEIIAVGGQRWRTGESIDDQLVGHPVDKPIEIALFRRGRLVQASLVPQESPLRNWSFTPQKSEALSAIQREVLTGWLGVNFETAPSPRNAAASTKGTPLSKSKARSAHPRAANSAKLGKPKRAARARS